MLDQLSKEIDELTMLLDGEHVENIIAMRVALHGLRKEMEQCTTTDTCPMKKST